ncbi:PREDICTED: F-box/LRR-repeat protein 14 isoform X2 [Tarenaya hassleriana]|uniref:F-box/LRR-repeat protein 14 isoform X2 n=1 Tax=Tarenaya hassleriana TaxID=28532 RepID=UPI00053C1D03|nr:PREDICTED: F-box/LRR-repeat protein 14 isoform X2 [Tarenaya hassleriana]
MDELPDHLVWDILRKLQKTRDRNSASLSCKRLCSLDNEQRHSLRIGCGLVPAKEALASLCTRFPNLSRVEIIYSGWMSKLGKQLDDNGLLVLTANCHSLTELTLSYCTFITDVGLRYLSSCSKLSSMRLNFTPRITGCGILSLAIGCKKLTSLHLIRCLNVTSVEWLEYLGKLENLEELCIKNCRAIGEGDLMKLGRSWRKIRSLQFEVDANYRYMKVYDRLSVDKWQKQLVPCENLVELSLANCIINPGRGLACILSRCKNLEKLHLDMCVGVRDSDIVGLVQRAKHHLRSISLRVPSDFTLPLLNNITLRLTDESLRAIAQNSSKLESFKISFSDGELPSLFSFTLDGIITLIQSCPIRELTLDHVCSFSDTGMEALCSAQNLEMLELVQCQEVGDEGLILVSQFPRLTGLKLVKCLGISDEGLRPLVGSHKLDLIVVEDCPQVSERGVHGAARSVSFRQDLSWMF